MLDKFERFKLSGMEIEEVELSLMDIKASKELCEQSLVGRIYGVNRVNYTGLKHTMSKLWCSEGTLRMVELKNKMYQFFFSKDEERRRVLDRRPWTFDNQMLVIQPWTKDIVNNEAAFLKTQIWVQIWNIPAQWLSSDVVWKIGKAFNKCLNVLIPETGSKDGRYAKMLVDVDLSKPMPRGTSVSFEGDKYWVWFRYEQLPTFCLYCGRMGHGERHCEVKVEDAKKGELNEGQFGLWLRADSGRLLTKYTGAGAKILSISSPHKPDTGSTTGRGGFEREGREGGGQREQIIENVANAEKEKGCLGPNKGGEQERGCLWEREVSSDNKENEASVPMPMLREDRGLEAKEVISLGLEHKGSDWGNRVLKELDCNISPPPPDVTSRNKQGGTWKRRNCTTGKKKKGGQEVENRGDEDKNGIGGKRGFCLVDVEETLENAYMGWKKPKQGEDAMIICDNEVEEASQKWPQADQ